MQALARLRMVRGFALALETTMAPSASWTGRCKTISMILCFSFLQFYFEGAGCGSGSVCGCGHNHHPHPCLSLHVEVSSINQLWLIIIICCFQTGTHFGSRDSKLSNLSPSSVKCVFLCFTEKNTFTFPKIWGRGAIKGWLENVQIEHCFQYRGRGPRYWMSSLRKLKIGWEKVFVVENGLEKWP